MMSLKYTRKSFLLASAVAAITLRAFSFTIDMVFYSKLTDRLTNSYTNGLMPFSVPSTKFVKAANKWDVTLGTVSSFNLAINIGNIVGRKVT